MYDITNSETLETAERWIADVKDNCPSDVKIYLAGNKNDLYEKQEVSRKEGQKLATDHELNFYETSAKENTGIPELFKHMATQMANKKRNRAPTINLTDKEGRANR